MIKLVPIAIELEIARAKPMYLSPGETEEISPPLIASVRKQTFKGESELDQHLYRQSNLDVPWEREKEK
jgi:hypothetical protein